MFLDRLDRRASDIIAKIVSPLWHGLDAATFETVEISIVPSESKSYLLRLVR